MFTIASHYKREAVLYSNEILTHFARLVWRLILLCVTSLPYMSFQMSTGDVSPS